MYKEHKINSFGIKYDKEKLNIIKAGIYIKLKEYITNYFF